VPPCAADAGVRQTRGRGGPDAPARHGGRRLGQRTALAGSVPPVKQHRRPAIGGCKLQAPGCRLVGRPDFGDDAGKRAVTQGILCQGKNLGILVGLCIKDLVRPEAGLLETRRIKVEVAHCPQDRHSILGSEACGYTGGKERGCGIVRPAGTGSGDLVKGGTGKAVSGELRVDLRDAERQCRTASQLSLGDLRTQRGKLFRQPGAKGGVQEHGSIATHMFSLCSVLSELASRRRHPRGRVIVAKQRAENGKEFQRDTMCPLVTAERDLRALSWR